MPEIIVSNETGQSNDTSKDINEISFVGRMISRNETQGCLTMHFRTTTPRKEGAKPFTNTLTLLCFDDEAKGKIGACRLMETVRVKGYISSSKKRDTEGGEPRRRRARNSPLQRKDSARRRLRQTDRQLRPSLRRMPSPQELPHSGILKTSNRFLL